MLSNKINQLIGDAMKAHNEVRTSTLRLLSSAFNYERIAKQHDLTEEEELAVIRRQAKQRKDSIDAYQKAGASDRASKEAEELKILQEFLPPEMEEEELNRLIDYSIKEIGATSMADMGKVIGTVKSKAGNSVDGGRIAELVKTRLKV
jgi:uncharacterized protein